MTPQMTDPCWGYLSKRYVWLQKVLSHGPFMVRKSCLLAGDDIVLVTYGQRETHRHNHCSALEGHLDTPNGE